MSLPRIVVTGVDGSEATEIGADEEFEVEPSDAGDATLAGISAAAKRNEKRPGSLRQSKGKDDTTIDL